MDLNNKHEYKADENLHEYESLRNEIITMEELQRNVWIYMYVLFGTLFVLGLQWSHYLFLVTYIILIPFQCVINNFLWSISKISTYIRVFFEDERCDMNWENFHIFKEYQEYYKNKSSSLTGLIRISGSVHLGVLATGFFCGYTLNNSWHEYRFVLNGIDIVSILLSVILLGAIIMINRDYTKEHHHELQDIMEQYKEKIRSEKKGM